MQLVSSIILTRMKAFSDGGGIDEEAIAEATTNIRVQLPQWKWTLYDGGKAKNAKISKK